MIIFKILLAVLLCLPFAGFAFFLFKKLTGDTIVLRKREQRKKEE